MTQLTKEEIEMIERGAKSYSYALWQPHSRFEDEIEQTIVDFKRGYMVALKAERERAGKLMEALVHLRGCPFKYRGQVEEFIDHTINEYNNNQ